MERKVILITDETWKGYYEVFWGHQKYIYHEFDITTKRNIEKGASTLLELIDKLISEDPEKRVPLLICNTDESMLAHCHVVEVLKKKGIEMLGANMTGFTVCTYKILARRLVSGMQSIKYAPVYSTEEYITDQGNAIDGKLLCKPISESGSIGINVVDLNNEEKKAKNPFFGREFEHRDFLLFTTILKFMKPEELKDLVGIAEGYIAPESVYMFGAPFNFCVDGYIQNGKVVEISTADCFYHTNNPQKFDFCSSPSVLEEKYQKMLIDRFHVVCNSLHTKFGVDNQIICVEMFFQLNKEDYRKSEIHVIEVNHRASMNNIQTFMVAYKPPLGDFFEVTKLLQLGVKLPAVELTGNTGVCLYREMIPNAPNVILSKKKKEGEEEDISIVYYNVISPFGDSGSHLFFKVEGIGSLQNIRKKRDEVDIWFEEQKKKYSST